MANAIINRLPKGLLSLLDMQTQGSNPQHASPDLILVSDCTAHYRVQSLVGSGIAVVVDNTSTATTIATGIAPITVPEGEVWEVQAIASRFTPLIQPASNENVEISIEQRIPALTGGDIDIALAVRQATLRGSLPIGGYTEFTYQPAQRFIANPGTTFRARITQVSTGYIGLGDSTMNISVARYVWRI